MKSQSSALLAVLAGACTTVKTQLPSGSELSLYDIAPVTPGVAVDLSHIPTAVKIKGFQVKMRLRRWKVQMSFLSLQA